MPALACLLAGTSLASSVHADILAGRVTGITDGDTLTLLVEHQAHTIRIAGIDAPERHQAWGSQSKTNVSRLAMNRDAIADCVKFDRWGRSVCKVRVDAADVGLEQVRDGMAWWYRRYAGDQPSEDRSAYENAEFLAKARRLGLWHDTHPVPPWAFRRGP